MAVPNQAGQVRKAADCLSKLREKYRPDDMALLVKLLKTTMIFDIKVCCSNVIAINDVNYFFASFHCLPQMFLICLPNQILSGSYKTWGRITAG